MQIKRAIILSAGYGKRLNPLTLSKPKPLLEINNKTLLENTIYLLEKFGIEEIMINTHYLSDQISTFIDNKKFSSKIFLIKEHERILDTGGGVLNAAKKFNKDPFFVFNPDTIWSQSYLEDFKCMEEQYFSSNYKSILLVVDKAKSFDKTMNGDFNLKKKLQILYKQLKFKNKTFVHRDFHVSNLMKINSRIGIIDSQDAIIGNPTYDLV